MNLWHSLSFTKLVAVALLTCVPTIVLFGVYIAINEACLVLEWGMALFSGVLFSFPVILDKFSLVFSSVVVVISFSVMLFSVSYMSGDPHLEYFIIMVVMFVTSMNLLIFVPNLLFLLLGWDGLGLTSYLLVIYYQNDKSLSAGMITAMTNRIGDALLILASCWSFAGGVWSPMSYTYNFMMFVGLCVGIGCMTKSAQVPFSSWLPAAMAAPTPVSALVHSSTLVTAGVYVVIRFYPSLSSYDFFFVFAFYLGVITCLMASLSALYESDMKKVVALSTLSQLGVMVMGLGLGLPTLAFFHLVSHALFKALLFICVGIIIHVSGNNQDLRMMGGLWYSMPMTCSVLNTANLALFGFPFMAGFYSKDLIIECFMHLNFPIITSALMGVSICLTGGYTMRMSLATLWTPFKGVAFPSVKDESFITYYAFFLLGLGAISGGAMFSWFICPLTGVMVLPIHLKLATLCSLTLLSFISFVVVNLGCKWAFTYLMGSMWFLSFISSSPSVKLSFYLGNLFYMQEYTWVELFSGKGVLKVMSSVSSSFQLSQNLPFSKLFSLFTLMVVFSMFLT